MKPYIYTKYLNQHTAEALRFQANYWSKMFKPFIQEIFTEQNHNARY